MSAVSRFAIKNSFFLKTRVYWKLTAMVTVRWNFRWQNMKIAEKCNTLEFAFQSDAFPFVRNVSVVKQQIYLYIYAARNTMYETRYHRQYG